MTDQLPPNPFANVPPYRRLRVFAFDPSLALHLDTAGINEIVIRVPWEQPRALSPMRGMPQPAAGPPQLTPLGGLQRGPVGEYLEVVDVDPASGAAYPPVDLNDPAILAQDGLDPSEGNP